MGQLKEQMISSMKARGYAEASIEAYTGAVETIANRLGRSPLSLTRDDFESYFKDARDAGASEATRSLRYEGLKCFLRMHGLEERIPAPPCLRRPRSFPVVLDKARIATLLGNCVNLRDRALFTLAYSSGLRLSELLALKPSDLDLEKGLVHVRRGKNLKDRYSIMGTECSKLLKEHIAFHRPSRFLFNSMTDIARPLSPDSARNRFRALARLSGLPEGSRIHSLRHSFATHLLEAGTSIVHIMRLLGHSHIQTTLIYLHLETESISGLASPMDSLVFSPACHAVGTGTSPSFDFPGIS